MKMTNQEIIERLRTMKAAWIFAADATPESQEMVAWASEAINGAISVLEGPTREQVEKVWRGEWQGNNGGYPHSECRWGNDETLDADDYCSFAERMEVNKNG